MAAASKLVHDIRGIMKNQDGGCNFDAVAKMIAEDENGLAAFLELVQEDLQAVGFRDPIKDPGFLLKFKDGGELVAQEIPLDLWKKIVPFVPELSIHGFNKELHKPMIEAVKDAKSLQKVDNAHDIGFELWKCLIPSSVKYVRTCPRQMFSINYIVDNKFIEELEVFFKHPPGDPTISFDFANVVQSFQAPRCKSIKLDWSGKFIDFAQFYVEEPKVQEEQVIENLALKLNYLTTMAITASDALTELLESFPAIFPHLVKANLMFYFKRDEELQEFAPIGTLVERLTELVEAAGIGYDLEMECICESKLEDIKDGNKNAAGDAENQNLEGLGFVKDGTTDGWKLEKQIAGNKLLKVAYSA